MNTEKKKKLALYACIVLALLLVTLPFTPYGQRVTYYDFNNGNIVVKYNYFLWPGKTEVMPSPLSRQLKSLGAPRYPELLTELERINLVSMKQQPVNTFRQATRMLDSMEMFGNIAMNQSVPLSETLIFRDEILNQWGAPELIAEAKNNPEARGGYIENAKWKKF